ncbi:unnamed protein product [Rotaria sordida]|uniref:Uncharacterized protein n=1 Tax=Rotaria sordida TaxID=392033 RepID=A0A814WDZ5_9BILA|nr:unnamed protein product [Rotaria sordida]CAF1472596.1 unnamed protein product [Rotaria sordida]
MATGGGYDKYGSNSSNKNSQNRNNDGNFSSGSNRYNQDSDTSRHGLGYGSNLQQYDSNTSQQDTTSRLSDLDKQTLQLVEELKRKTQTEIRSNQSTVNENFIEQHVANIRRSRNSKQLNAEEWKTYLSQDNNNCPDSILEILMAYGDNPIQVKTVLQKKINEIESPTDTSLDKIIEPLKKLKKETSDFSASSNLFNTVLKIDDNKIDRADRIFYSEACQMMGNQENYTVDNAHDQVQAVRLMHYSSEDKNELYRLIKNYRTFDDAYSYLQSLTRQRAKIFSSTASTSTTMSSSKPNVHKSLIKAEVNKDDNGAINNPHSCFGSDSNRNDYNAISPSSNRLSSAQTNRPKSSSRSGGQTSSEGINT